MISNSLPILQKVWADLLNFYNMENPFSEGDKVICVSEDFPWLPQHGGIGPAKVHPVKNEILIVDEILGDFLRFDKYDTINSFNWWHHTRFQGVSESDLTALELVCDYNVDYL